MKAADRRGVWRGTYVALFEDPDFLRLTPTARHVLLTLRFGPSNNPLSIFPLHVDALAGYTGLDREALEAALTELERKPSKAKPWVYRGSGLLWIRNGFRYEPTVSRDNPNHWSWVNRLVAGLPRVPLVQKFRKYYDLPWVPHPHSDGGRDGGSDGGTDGEYPNQYPHPHQNPHPERPERPSLSSQGSNNGKVRPTAEMWNECAEGRAERCVKTRYLGEVDLPVQCDAHTRARGFA